MPTRPPWPPANELLSLAVAHLEAAIPRLVLVGGLPGTGKSTIARRIGDAYRCPVLRSDVVRKLMADLDPQTPAPAPYASGLYRAEVSARTYAGLLEEAAQLLGRGHSVVVDASWSDRSWRQAALDLGDRSGSVVVQLRCQAPPQVAAHRIAARAARGGSLRCHRRGRRGHGPQRRPMAAGRHHRHQHRHRQQPSPRAGRRRGFRGPNSSQPDGARARPVPGTAQPLGPLDRSASRAAKAAASDRRSMPSLASRWDT